MYLNIFILTYFNHYPMHTLEPEPMEQEPELQTEQAPADECTNPKLAQGKLQCIPPQLLDFNFICLLDYYLIVH
jgi:hypothetical protein